ncbi:MAG: hypothetical protein FWB75_09865 [Oscillospiraceae bacterium]|nr:hypothetical protein [Oscillospiraceae bacterium]
MIGFLVNLLCILANVAINVISSLYAAHINSCIERRTGEKRPTNPR